MVRGFDFSSFVLDLKAELAVSSTINPKTRSAVEDPNGEFKEIGTVKSSDTVDNMTNTTPLQIREVRERMNGKVNSSGTTPVAPFVPNPALTPAARISALNIVGDLLRKVGVSMIHII